MTFRLPNQRLILRAVAALALLAVFALAPAFRLSEQCRTRSDGRPRTHHHQHLRPHPAGARRDSRPVAPSPSFPRKEKRERVP